MRAVKSRDTKPEVEVRRTLHALGFRFRLHRADLPGSPDIVLPGKKKIILVNGCFWHGHPCPRGNRLPKSNSSYWTAKIQRNKIRDIKNLRQLLDAGWKVMVVWECEIKRGIAERLMQFLNE
jgi:DNA mismatch endonuclease (patch repair protein)